MASAASSSPAMLLLKLSVLVLFFFHGASAATHIVGGNQGWIVRSDASFYQQWAASQNFSVGDVLVFNFATNQHTVAEVSRNQYDSCTDPSSGVFTSSTNFTLEEEGTYYYICTVAQHCELGQKVAVTVTATAGSSSSPTPANGPNANTPPTAPDAPTPSTVNPTLGTGTPTAVLGTGVTAAAMGLAVLLI